MVARMSTATAHRSNGQHAAHHNAGAIVVLCAEEEVRDIIAYWLASAAGQDADRGRRLSGGAKRSTTAAAGWSPTGCCRPGRGSTLSSRLRSQHPDLRIAFVENGNMHDGILAKVTGASVLLPRPLTRRSISEALANGHG